MNVAIMAESIKEKMNSQGIVTLNVVKYLSKNNKNIDLTIIGSEYLKSLEMDVKKIIYKMKTPVEQISNNIKLINRLNKEKIDLIHCPVHFGPPYFWFLKTNKVRTIYDAYGPEMHKILNFNQLRLKLKFNCLEKMIDGIATISESSKREIIKHYGFENNKIDVIYLGIDERYRPLDKNKCKKIIRDNYNIKKPFIFHLSACDERKNIPGIIKGFINAKKNNKEISLVIGGGTKRIPNFYKELDKNIIFLDYLPNEELPIFYNAAEIFLFPSFHEGFGLPILESMGCGTPVITSNISATKEIARDAAVIINPYDSEDIGKGINTLLNNRDIWNSLQKKGLKRSKEFNWEKCAKGYTDFYKKIL